jgi:hypothetical protein
MIPWKNESLNLKMKDVADMKELRNKGNGILSLVVFLATFSFFYY